jgi:hypothetical protein
MSTLANGDKGLFQFFQIARIFCMNEYRYFLTPWIFNENRKRELLLTTEFSGPQNVQLFGGPRE